MNNLKDLAYALAMEARRPKCPTCGGPAIAGGPFSAATKDGGTTVTGYAFTCPNKHHWKTGSDHLPVGNA